MSDEAPVSASQVDRRLLRQGWQRDPTRDDVWTKDVSESARERMAAAASGRHNGLGWIFGAIAIGFVAAILANLHEDESKKR